jgi:hypothetical protein
VFLQEPCSIQPQKRFVLDYEGNGMLIFTHEGKTRERALSFEIA